VRALRFDGKSLRLETAHPEPAAAPGEAVIRLRRAGVSELDLQIASGGGRSRLLGTLGHQFVGVVESMNLPSDAPPSLQQRRALKGRRVVASPTLVCGHCDMCRSGLSVHCRSRQVLGVRGRDGCFADLVAVPLANLYRVPDSIDDDQAVLAAPLACALHATHMIRTEGKSYITVLGDTLLGLLTAQTLTRLNASVRLLGSRPDRLRLCERWGVKHRPVEEAGRRQDQDAVIDCTGTSAGLRLAMQHVRPRGTIVLKSASATAPFPPGAPFPETPDAAWGAPVDLTPIVSNEVNVVGSRDGSIPDALALLERAEVDTAGLITRRFKLDEAIAALRTAAEPDQLKVVIDP
jgi:threonine dehydrogenase-like Zn-dependent dehydrogenase